MNRRIIAILSEDARIGASELARRVGMSAPAVRERLNRLEQAGVIRGYRLDLDPAAMDSQWPPGCASDPAQGNCRRSPTSSEPTPQVSECHRISGEDCFLLKVHVPAIEALEDILDRFLLHGQTTSSLIVSTPVPPRALTPAAARGKR